MKLHIYKKSYFNQLVDPNPPPTTCFNFQSFNEVFGIAIVPPSGAPP